MKIGIIETGRPPAQLHGKFGTYDHAFRRLLADFDFEFECWASLLGELPESIHSADGWLITGSKFGTYEDHDWIAPLEQFLRDTYAAKLPIVGICFGHQLLAQALGGKVEKYSGGWSVGRVEYSLDIAAQDIPLYAWHQDQVTELPPDATVVGSTHFCQYAALRYGSQAYTIQPHPEFSESFIEHLLEARKDVLPRRIATQATASLENGATDSPQIARYLAEFFHRGHEARQQENQAPS